jgi:hypothetical protein
MRTRVAALALCLLAPVALRAQAPPKPALDAPVRAAYYYKVRWGLQDEFERLFLKNHYPVLLEDIKAGHVKSVNLYRPTFHGDGRADWTYLVVITYTNWAALAAPRDEAVVKRLYPDQETFKREEQRRFEILDAHWDVPLTEIQPPK